MTPENGVVVAKYAELSGQTQSEFVNEFLTDFLISNFEDPASGAAEGYLVNRHYPDRQIAERVVAWLKNRTKEDSAHCGYPISLKARIQKSAEGFFKIVASQSWKDRTYKF